MRGGGQGAGTAPSPCPEALRHPLEQRRGVPGAAVQHRERPVCPLLVQGDGGPAAEGEPCPGHRATRPPGPGWASLLSRGGTVWNPASWRRLAPARLPGVPLQWAPHPSARALPSPGRSAPGPGSDAQTRCRGVRAVRLSGPRCWRAVVWGCHAGLQPLCPRSPPAGGQPPPGEAEKPRDPLRPPGPRAVRDGPQCYPSLLPSGGAGLWPLCPSDPTAAHSESFTYGQGSLGTRSGRALHRWGPAAPSPESWPTRAPWAGLALPGDLWPWGCSQAARASPMPNGASDPGFCSEGRCPYLPRWFPGGTSALRSSSGEC